jgi:hypothetical protein
LTASQTLHRHTVPIVALAEQLAQQRAATALLDPGDQAVGSRRARPPGGGRRRGDDGAGRLPRHADPAPLPVQLMEDRTRDTIWL